jgi:hypothetical protein
MHGCTYPSYKNHLSPLSALRLPFYLCLSILSLIPFIISSTTQTSKMEDNMNLVLSVVMHVLIGMVLLIYIPISLLVKLVRRVFIRPFEKEVDLKGKIVLITGASSGIGEVYFSVSLSFLISFHFFY